MPPLDGKQRIGAMTRCYDEQQRCGIAGMLKNQGNNCSRHRMPQLLKQGFTIIVIAKGSLDIAKTSRTVVAGAIILAAGLGAEDQDSDTICLNLQQNIVVTNTPKKENAGKYLRIKQCQQTELRHQRLRGCTTHHLQGSNKREGAPR
ncbi:hypothetical protein HPB51_015188 [Rhipicephalus microplus]|uniref:Uncharacterized protein n=1 Tax=Rhipicephalus microplus TaxID=6941 RepID=A0A9J6F3L8_RHIMP|nr:hypothetical protein HPB51_015188 [Rhipicephalus microplus]